MFIEDDYLHQSKSTLNVTDWTLNINALEVIGLHPSEKL